MVPTLHRMPLRGVILCKYSSYSFNKQFALVCRQLHPNVHQYDTCSILQCQKPRLPLRRTVDLLGEDMWAVASVSRLEL